MTQPSVTLTELDGALGVLPASAGKMLAAVGVSSTGPLNTPATFARVTDVRSTFGKGPLVEFAAYFIDRYARPIVLVRSANTTAGAVGAVDDTAVSGTSDVTVTASPAPTDDFELVLKIVTDGTRGTAGITYVTSLDGGRNWSPVSALGTATSITFPDGAGVGFDLSAGTLVAGDIAKATATAPKATAADIGTALDALKNTLAAWELVHVLADVDATMFDTIETKVAGMQAAGKYHAWIGNTRIQGVSEAAATYMSELAPLSAAKSTILGSLYAGGGKLTSPISSRKFRRPTSWVAAAREGSVKPHINIADPNLGALPGISIRDDNGNPDEYDESVNPGLDDLRFGTLRTLEGYPGVYVNRPRLFAPPASDFQIMPYRRVMNIGHEALRAYFTGRLNKQVIVSRATGFLLPSEATEIELGAIAALRSALLAEPYASAVDFKLSRTDNVLSTKTVTGQARILPLAYPEFFSLSVGFINPAMLLQAA